MAVITGATRVLTVLPVICGLSSCGDEGRPSIDADRGNKSSSIDSYDVVQPNESLGRGAEVKPVGARVLNGEIQVLVEGFACGAPAELLVDESDTEVAVQIYGSALDEDAICSANVVFWFVPLALAEPLGGRSLVDSDAELVEVSNCSIEPESNLCQRGRS